MSVPTRQRGWTVLEMMVVLSLLATLLVLGVVGVTKFMSQRTLLGWSDIVVNDIRGAQQVGIARRAAVVVTFVAKNGSAPASYTATLGGTTVRSQSLPAEINVTAQTIQFSSLGIPSSAGALSVQLSDSATGQARTITVNPVTGSVTAQ